MNQLTCLPQDSVLWGTNILADAVARFADHGIERPITFTVAPLESLNETALQPHIRHCLLYTSDAADE